jgi:hypothetical protein
MTSKLFEGASTPELKKLRELIAAAHRLRGLLRLFADRLPPAPPEAPREILRSRIDCVLADYIAPAIRDLESALAEVEEAAAP